MALVVKDPPANTGDSRGVGLIPGLGSSPGGGNGTPLRYSCLGNPMDREAWRATILEVTKSWTLLITRTQCILSRILIIFLGERRFSCTKL